jgi:3-phenylpropionate/trans-cinnamate dioxygenase beta subunit/p-cumate 2,3-dioxygenase beta subunit
MSLRSLVEDFMFAEARLLDDWRLTEWLELLTETCMYEVPATDVRGGDALGLIADDRRRLEERVKQLLRMTTLCENPPSRTRRLITNVSVLAEVDDRIDVVANFVIHRISLEREDVFVGKYEYELRRRAESFRIQRRRALLDHQTLFSQGKLSIIL